MRRKSLNQRGKMTDNFEDPEDFIGFTLSALGDQLCSAYLGFLSLRLCPEGRFTLCTLRPNPGKSF